MNTSTKECFKCKAVKPLSDFYAHNKMADGHLNKCKSCAKTDARVTRRSNIEYYREYDRKRGNRQTTDYLRKYRDENLARYKAHNAVSNAVRDGRLVKEPCFMCGSKDVVGHHPDYSKPLEVIWLCQGCHKLIHAYEDRASKIKSLNIVGYVK